MDTAILLHFPRELNGRKIDRGQRPASARHAIIGAQNREDVMADLVFVLCGVAFFAAAIGYTLICERL